MTKNDAIDRTARNFGLLRTIPFRFRTDWEKWKPYWDGKKLKETPLPEIELERGTVKWDLPSFRKRISNEARSLATLKFSGLRGITGI